MESGIENISGMWELGQRKRSWQENTGKYLKQLGWKLVEWIRLAQDNIQCHAVVNTSIKPRLQ
jgi:hypothetical protein